jgi:hypothetical protein
MAERTMPDDGPRPLDYAGHEDPPESGCSGCLLVLGFYVGIVVAIFGIIAMIYMFAPYAVS